MNVLNNTISRLNYLITEVPEKITAIPEEKLSFKRAPDKWSVKELMGHLCDSGVNNLSRFIRAQFEPEPFAVVSYDQDEWVKANHYQEMEISDIIEFWASINKRIIFVVSKMSEEKLAVVCDLGNAAFREGEIEKTLLWLIEDYLVHMEYHLRQIIQEDWLRDDYKTS